MAWTTPRTWTDGELVTAAIMNTHVRDNLNAIGNHFHVRKTAAETVTSSTALQNDDHLLFAIGASEIWGVQCFLFCSGATTGDIKFAWSVPSGATGTFGGIGPTTSQAQSATITDVLLPVQSTLATAEAFGVTSGGGVSILLWATIVNSTNAGTVNLQWAQQTSDGTATQVAANSWLLAHRIA